MLIGCLRVGRGRGALAGGGACRRRALRSWGRVSTGERVGASGPRSARHTESREDRLDVGCLRRHGCGSRRETPGIKQRQLNTMTRTLQRRRMVLDIGLDSDACHQRGDPLRFAEDGWAPQMVQERAVRRRGG